MIRIIDSRGTGKTKKLIEKAKENNTTIVCKNPYVIQTKAIRYGIVGLKVISYEDLFNNYSPEEVYYIDELEDFVKIAFPSVSIEGYTLNLED